MDDGSEIGVEAGEGSLAPTMFCMLQRLLREAAALAVWDSLWIEAALLEI